MFGIDWDNFLGGFWDSIKRMLGGSAQDEIEKILKELSTGAPSLDLTGSIFEVYDGMLAIALLLGAVASAVQLIRIIWLPGQKTLIDLAKILPVTYVVGASLPYLTASFAGVLGDLHRGIVSWLLDRPLNEQTFAFQLDGDFGLGEVIIGWIGAKVLQIEQLLLMEYMAVSLLVLVAAMGLRWFGFFGNGLFMLAVGVFVTLLFGTTAMIFMLCLFWMGAGLLSSGLYLVVAIFVAACMPLVVFYAYFKFGFSQKVQGAMESRLLSNQLSVRAPSNESSSGGLSHKVALAGAGALAGALYARESGLGRPDDQSFSTYQRARSSDRMMAAASMMTKTHPVSAVALLYGSKIIKPRDKTLGEG